MQIPLNNPMFNFLSKIIIDNLSIGRYRFFSTLKVYVLGFALLTNVKLIQCDDSIFQNTEFYYNFSQDLDPESSERIAEILNKGVIDFWKDPRYLKSFRMIEKSTLLNEFIKYQKVLRSIVGLGLLKSVDDKRYFYMRESIRRVARSSIDTSVENAVNLLIDSDLIAVFIDSQFRAMVVPLIESGYLPKYFSIVGDLNHFEKNIAFKKKWDSLYERYLKVNYPSDAKTISLMELVKNSSEQVKNRARDIRDSRFYEVQSTPKQKMVLNSPLYKVYDGYIRDARWSSAIQLLTKKKLFFDSVKSGEEKVKNYFTRILKKKVKKNKDLLQDFISSLLFKDFLSADHSAMYIFLQEEGILNQFILHIEDIDYLLKKSKTPQFQKSQLALNLKKKKIGNDQILKKKRQIDSQSCYVNMSKMMDVREKYSYKMRKEVYIKTPQDRVEFFKETGLKLQVCPTGGKYLSSKFGRIQCTYHGDAPITHIE